jgi:peptidoglycan/xylan/chitin deacetylase (PgdA/CDA1 family)
MKRSLESNRARAIGTGLARSLVVVVVLAALAGFLGAGPTSASSLSIRLEAGPHPAVRFDADWAITARRTVTLSSPITVTGSRRLNVPGPRGVFLKVASGALAGWWVREDRVSYVPGIVGRVSWSPWRTADLSSGAWELYRFDAAGTMTAATGRTVATSWRVRLDRAAVVNGRRHVRIADGAWAGWWLPGSPSTPTPITCTAGSPPTASTGRVVRSVPTASGEIALTFDMGGRLTPALSIIRFLELERICATIFPTGTMAQTETGRQVMAEVRAHPELFEVGNHTVHHCNLRDGGGGSACPTTRPPAAFVAAELQGANTTIEGLAGRSSVPWWRPPYGAVDAQLVADAAAAGYPYTVLWSTDTIDWRTVANGGPTAAQTAAKVIANRKPGAIVLMHLGGYTTRNALPAMIHGLRAAGYHPTTLSDLYR